jgi:hypothetical protein
MVEHQGFPAAPAPKKKRHTTLWIILGVVGLLMLAPLVSKDELPSNVQVTGEFPEASYTASNGYVLDTAEQQLADFTWIHQPAADQTAICTALQDEDPDSTTFQVMVQAFAEGSGYSQAESQAVLEYLVAEHC